MHTKQLWPTTLPSWTSAIVTHFTRGLEHVCDVTTDHLLLTYWELVWFWKVQLAKLCRKHCGTAADSRLSCLLVSICLSVLPVCHSWYLHIVCVCDSINMKSLFIATFSIAKICKTNTAATNPNNPSPKIHPRRPTLPQRKCQLSVKRNTKLEMKGGGKGGQQHWHCDVQGALCWSARPKLKLRRYHLHTGFFNARHERSIEI